MISPRAPQDGDRSRKVALPGNCRAIGAQLAETRDSRQLSVEKIASTLLLSRGQVLGLEHADPSAFYNHAFFLKALRKYMALMDVPADLLVEEEPADDEDGMRLMLADTSGPLPDDGPARSRSRAPIAAAVGAAIIGAAVFVVPSLWGNGGTDGDTVSLSVDSPLPAQPPGATNAQTAPATATPASATKTNTDPDSRVRISVGKSTWVYVRYPDNRVVERKLAAGEDLEVGPLPVYLAVGTAEEVEVRVQDKPVPLGPFIRDGQVRMTHPDLVKLVP